MLIWIVHLCVLQAGRWTTERPTDFPLRKVGITEPPPLTLGGAPVPIAKHQAAGDSPKGFGHVSRDSARMPTPNQPSKPIPAKNETPIQMAPVTAIVSGKTGERRTAIGKLVAQMLARAL